MRRSIYALTFITCLVPVASIAAAQDAQPDAGAPNPTTTTTVTAPPTQTAAPTQTATPTPTPPVQTANNDQEPLRLGRMIELEADRARSRRYGASTVQMVLGAGAIVSSGLIFTLDFTGVDSGLQTMIDILAVTGMIAGGLTIVDGLISMFIQSPMERLFDRYAPVAIDTSLSPSDRLRRGEMLLEGMANAERTNRITGGVSTLVLGLIETGFAIFIGADNDLWGTDANAMANRAIFTTTFALLAATSIGEAVGKIVWERGPAEVAWEHWHASHGSVSVQQTAKVHFKPYFGPTHGGATAGFSLRF